MSGTSATRPLHEVLSAVDVLDATGNLETHVRHVHIDSRDVRAGDLFVALRGGLADGHEFVDQALAQGAAAVLAMTPAPEDFPAPWIRVADTRDALPHVAAALYRAPSRSLRLVGVTGTNGKTTVGYLLESVIAAAGHDVGVFGTVSVRYSGREVAASLTTPEAHTLQATLRAMVDAGVSHAVMEVSSHAIDQKRAVACHFAAGVFTNLSRDHLDFHGDVESYAAVKEGWLVDDLPEGGLARGAAINLDDEVGRRIAGRLRVPLMGYSRAGHPDAAVRARELSCDIDGIRMSVETPRGVLPIASPLLGHHNAENILATIAAAELLDLPHTAIREGIAELACVPGRLEPVPNRRKFTALVDYAHTDDALDNVTRALQPLKRGRLITVFGCGGDRDRTKRPAMGAVAVRNSDITVVTSDNPRTEDPAAIVRDILPGLTDSDAPELCAGDLDSAERGYFVEVDRRTAIRLAVSAAQPGDTLLVAGKGHEDYQIIGRTKTHFDDREEIAAALAALD